MAGNNAPVNSQASIRSAGSSGSQCSNAPRRLRPSGGYRSTCSFQTATIIYDATYWFCEKFLDPRSRTVDQMVQAARSGRQNIAEGSRAAATSSQTELRLLNVARASLEELMLDFEDYLRHRHLAQWTPNCPEALAVRRVPGKFRKDRPDQSDLTDLTNQQRWALYAPWLDHADPTIRANAILCLINQANYLLDQQREALEASFVNEGGYSEQLAAARLAERERQRKAQRTDPTDPSNQPALSAHILHCPRCGKPMVLRTAKAGKNVGQQFWGCSIYPECKGVANI
jgi:restriction system protein